MTPPLLTAFRELKDYAEDVARSSPNSFQTALRRFLARLDGDPIGVLLQGLLPPVDFSKWYEAALATRSQWVGSGQQDWPTDTAERIALQAEYLRHLATGEIKWKVDFMIFHGGDDYQDYLHRFVQETFVAFHRDVVKLAGPALHAEDAAQPTSKTTRTDVGHDFVDPARIEALRKVSGDRFDLVRLIRFCEELNLAYANECYLAVAALTRGLMDHVPPVFGQANFAGVANNYGGGGKSFNEQMRWLDQSARKIGDSYLHGQIRNRESVPTRTQVAFNAPLDTLVGEIARIL